MSAILMVKGTIEHGRLREFNQTVEPFIDYRREQGMAVPQVLHGISGPMNTVCLIFRYENLARLDEEIRAERNDPRYGELASKMPYAADSIVYELYQAAD